MTHPTAPTRSTRTESTQSTAGAPFSPRLILTLTLVGVPVGTLLLVRTYDPDLGVSELWTILSASIVALSSVYRPSLRGAPLRWVAAALVVLVTLAAVATGLPWAQAAWIAVVNLLAAVVGLAVYRRGLDHPGWDARTPASIVSLLIASLAATSTVVLLVGHPTPLGDLDPRNSLWWLVRVFTGTWIGLVTFLVVVYWRRRPVGQRVHLAQAVAVYATGLLCLVFSYARPDLPISWLCLVPGLWAGLVFGPRAAAAYCLFLAVASGMVVNLEDIFDYTGVLPPAILIDLMMCFATFLTMLLALFRDQRLRMLAELGERRADARAQADLLRTVVDSMSDGLILAEHHGAIEWHNRAADALLHREMPSSPPTSWAAYFGLHHVETGEPITDDDLPLQYRSHHDRSRIEVTLDRPDGRPAVLSAESRLLRTRAGDRVVLMFHDVTAEHARHRELRQFAGTVAHDLKGPLSAVSGWVEAADDELAEDDPIAGRMALVRARDASGRMRGLIDEYLAHAVSREGALHPTIVLLGELAREVVAVHESSGPDAPRFVVDAPHTVEADRGMLGQLLANLVDNALKYRRPEEPAHVEVRSVAEQGWVRIDVVDRGLGLQPGDEERIFAAFSRSDKDADHVHGIGLGLSLCHSIVSRHGGTIRAAGNVHGGATFTVRLPV